MEPKEILEEYAKVGKQATVLKEVSESLEKYKNLLETEYERQTGNSIPLDLWFG